MSMATSGISGLDSQLGGGFPRGSTVLVLSEPSNAPFTLNEQFAAGGLNQNETVYFYSMERPRDEVVENVRGFLTREVEAKLVFFDGYAHKLKDLPAAALKRLGVSDHSVDVTKDVVPRMLHETGDKPFRVVIESLTQSAETFGLEKTLHLVEAVTGLSRKLNAIVLLTLIKGVTDPHFETRVRHLVDGVIEFGIDRQGFGLYSYILITKMRGVSEATKMLLYKETEKGLWLESTRRVF